MTIKENQSVPDVVTQKYGSFEAAFDFMKANDLSVTDDLFSNQQVETPESANKNTDVANYFAEKEYNFATGYPLIEEEANNDGIGAMIIGKTFIVR